MIESRASMGTRVRKVGYLSLLALIVLVPFAAGLPAESRPEISCGQTITADTTLDADLTCPASVSHAIVIGASNITLDLGGHRLSGEDLSTGVLAYGQEGITIRNGVIEGFNDGVFLIDTRQVTVEDLTIRNLVTTDPDHFIVGVHIQGSQDVVVSDSLVEFLPVAHKEGVDVYSSDVAVRDIEVRGGGAGVGFSWGGVCDPVNAPNTGSVTNSRFSEIYVAGFYIACTGNLLIEGNNISTVAGEGVGIQTEPPFFGAVTGLTIRGNAIHDTVIGIENRGATQSTIADNYVFDQSLWGIAMRPSLGCLLDPPPPGFDCFNSTGNLIAGNETWGSRWDLYHHEDSLGNTWQGNTCQTTDGVEIPGCTPPNAALTINYASGQPGSFFTLAGANFPPGDVATITVNGETLGTVPTDPAGDLTFLLNTDQADPGFYTVTAATNPSASAGFYLSTSKALRLPEGEGTVFSVPGGLTWLVYLPLVRR